MRFSQNKKKGGKERPKLPNTLITQKILRVIPDHSHRYTTITTVKRIFPTDI